MLTATPDTSTHFLECSEAHGRIIIIMIQNPQGLFHAEPKVRSKAPMGDGSIWHVVVAGVHPPPDPDPCVAVLSYGTLSDNE